MEYDKDKIDDMTLALLWLVMWDDDFGTGAWKGFDWETMNRLYQKGLIHDPKGKSKFVAITPEGRKKAEDLFRNHFVNKE